MQIKTDSKLSGWLLIPIGLAFFALPSVAVTVKSGATTVFLIILLPSLIFGWKSWGFLFQEEKILLTSFLVFVFLAGLSLINSSDVSEGVGSYEKILRFAVFIPMYLFIRSNNFEFGPWLSWGLVLGCAVTGLVAIYQFHWLDLPRPGGARHFTRYGLSAVTILLLLTLVMMFEWRKTKLLILGIILAAIILYAIKLNQTRAAMLAILPFIGLLLFYYRHNFNKKLALIFFLVIVIVGVIFLHPSSPVAQSFMQGFMELKALMQNPTENYDSSWGLRPHMLYTGLLIFMQSPTFGTGLGDYAHDALILMESGKTSIQDPWLLTSPHNIYVSLSACQLVSLSACQLVSLLAEAGLLGFLGMIAAVCIAPLYCYFKIYRCNSGNEKVNLYVLSGVTISICFLVFGLFHTWININNATSVFLLLHLVCLSNSFAILQNKKA